MPPEIVRPAPEERVEAWREDLAALAHELGSRHVAPFRRISRQDFEAGVAALDARIPELSDDGVVIELARIAASIGDGHTGFLLYGPRLGLRQGPLWLLSFADGVFVKGVVGDVGADVLNRRLLRVGGVEIEEALARIAPYIRRDNDIDLRSLAPAYLNLPGVLFAAALTAEPDAAVYTFEGDEGAEIELRCEVLPRGAPVVYAVRYSEPSQGAPLSERLRTKPYAHERLPGAVYVAFNRCHEDPARPFAEFCREVFAELDRDPSRHLIIDLRSNSGGDSAVVEPLLRGIERRPELARDHRVSVLIGRGTFSSGMWAAIDLKLACDATLFGEPTGGTPNAPGNLGTFALPRSTLDVNYSRNLWKKGGERFTGDALEPDVLVQETSRDHFAGIDPVLEAALRRAGQ